MQSKWDNFKKNVKAELFDTAATTWKYYKIGKVKLNVININNFLNDTYRELGIEVCNLNSKDVKGDIRDNPKVKSLIKTVDHLKQLAKDGELAIKAIKDESVAQIKKVENKANSPVVKAKKKAKKKVQVYLKNSKSNKV